MVHFMICIFNKFFQQRFFVVVIVAFTVAVADDGDGDGDGEQLEAYNASFASSHPPNQAIRTEILPTSLQQRQQQRQQQQRTSLKVKE